MDSENTAPKTMHNNKNTLNTNTDDNFDDESFNPLLSSEEGKIEISQPDPVNRF